MKVSIEFKHGVPRGWHEITEDVPAVYMDTIEFKSKEEYLHFCINYMGYSLVDGVLVYDEELKRTRLTPYQMERKIEELEKKLYDTDFRSIRDSAKFALNLMTEEELDIFKGREQERQSWRDEISSLRELL